MISRILPAVSAVTTRMPPGMRRAYGDISNRILDTSTVYRHLRSTVAEMGSALLDFSRPPETETEHRLCEFASLIRPYTSALLALTRVGSAADGAYAMAAVGENIAAAISIGVGHDVSWDQAIAAKRIPVTMFDPTVAELPSAVPGGTFHRIGIGVPEATPVSDLHGMDLRPLDDLLELAGVSDSTELLLKIDVEGAEWDALRDTDFAVFQQVLIEMHDIARLSDPKQAEAVLETVRKLAHTHYPVHVHANNEGAFNRFDRFWFPDVIEASYIRKDLLAGATPATHLVEGLDIPSNPQYPDYDMSGLLTASVLDT